MFDRFKSRLRAFRDDERGTIVTEAVLAMPMMFWVLITLYVAWDAYRGINIVQKATYTISDVISRRQAPVNADYLDGLNEVMDFLLDPNQESKMRFTSVRWNGIDEEYLIDWSYSPANRMAALDQDDADEIEAQLPVMADGDTVIVVEAEVDIEAAFNVQIVQDQTIRRFIVTRPRLVPQICFDGIPCGILAGGTASASNN